MNYENDIENLTLDKRRWINPRVLLEYIDDIKDKMTEAITNYEAEIQDLENQNEEIKTENNELKDKVEELKSMIEGLQSEVDRLEDKLDNYDGLG